MKLNGSLVKASVYGANDGIITTFAVVSGVTGASLDLKVIVILGIANLIADGISMGVSDYLGERAESDYRQHKGEKRRENPVWHTGVVTFTSFVIAGSVPLLPYFLANLLAVEVTHPFLVSSLGTALALFMVGVARTSVTKGSWWRNGIQVLSVGASAAVVAYWLGDVITTWLL
jgi:VIT1/CCC1 family predicted Fe2+/Mn2+ transporter